MRTTFALGATALFAVLAFAPAAEAAGATPMKFGMSLSAYDAMNAAGAKPDYAQYWVGSWVKSSGWGGLDAALAKAKANDVTLLVEWYYWGDDISPSCVKYGCDGKSVSEWRSLSATLAKRIAASGAKALVIVETEFNKNGIEGSYASTFDGHLRGVIDVVRANAPGAQVGIGYGNWNMPAWKNFPRSIAASDVIGFQAMAGSTRDSLTSYLQTDERIESAARHIRDVLGKPSILHDLSISSYPHPTWADHQRTGVQQIMDKAPTYASLGVVGIVYRQHKDTHQSFYYYWAAEGYMGLFKKDGSAKPAWSAWVSGVKAARATTGAFDATFSGVSGNVWWVQANVKGSEPLSGVDVRVDGGAWKPLTLRWWGAWAGSVPAPYGSDVQLRARSTSGATDLSSTYDWPR